MSVYWLSFRLSSEGKFADTYNKRYKALETVVESHAPGHFWKAPTSLFVFDSPYAADYIADKVRAVIALDADCVIISEAGTLKALILGIKGDPIIHELLELTAY